MERKLNMLDSWPSDEFIDEVVIVTRGEHKGRIGYCDDGYSRTKCIVYFGHMLVAFQKYFLISYKSLRKATTDDLLRRKEEVWRILFQGKVASIIRTTLLEEFMLISDKLVENMIQAKFLQAGNARKVFISHSHQDKEFATKLAVDLSNAGHYPWLDNWEILAGDSIPNKIAVGIKDCDFVIVILSKHSVNSHWVEREWEAKYLDETQSDKVKIIPALLEECEIPQLLKAKEYANFTGDYITGLNKVLLALNRIN